MSRRTAVMVMSLAMSLAPAVPALAQVKLEHKYPEGSSARYKLTTKTHQILTIAGMDVETNADHREPVNTNIWEMSYREKRRLRIDDLPHDLNEALDELEKDDVIRAALGTHIATNFLEAKRQEWRDYITQVTQWEIDNYLLKY